MFLPGLELRATHEKSMKELDKLRILTNTSALFPRVVGEGYSLIWAIRGRAAG